MGNSKATALKDGHKAKAFKGLVLQGVQPAGDLSGLQGVKVSSQYGTRSGRIVGESKMVGREGALNAWEDANAKLLPYGRTVYGVVNGGNHTMFACTKELRLRGDHPGTISWARQNGKAVIETVKLLESI